MIYELRLRKSWVKATHELVASRAMLSNLRVHLKVPGFPILQANPAILYNRKQAPTCHEKKVESIGDVQKDYWKWLITSTRRHLSEKPEALRSQKGWNIFPPTTSRDGGRTR